MLRKTFLLTLFAFLNLGLIFSQADSKSKSSAKLYERGGKKKEVHIRNSNFINTPRLDFSPQFYQNGIVYVSSGKSGPVDSVTKEPFFELFYAETDRNGMPMNPETFSVQLNSQKHEGPVSFSRDAKLIYFTRNNLKNGIAKANAQKKVGLKIYEATRGYFDWEKVKELPFNSDDYNCMHPALSPDGKRLYFASDMPGGQGNMDLWMVEKDGDNWGTPQNLGPEINTPGKEGFPFFHESGTLFFSSEGHTGLGGFDIYGVSLMGNGSVFNLGSPFNSEADDLGFILGKSGIQGFFASDREGGFGRDDIYTFEAPEGILGVEEEPKLEVTILVTDAETAEGIGKAEVRIMEQSEDGFLEGDDLYDVEMVPNPSNPDEILLKLVRVATDSLRTPVKKTFDNGETYAEVLKSKKYLILASKDGYKDGELMLDPNTLGESPKVTVALQKPALISMKGSIQMEGEDKTRISDATITIINNTNNTAQIIKTDDDGEFSFEVEPGATYSITAEKAGFHTGVSNFSTEGLEPGSELTADIKLQPYESGTEISGPVEEGDVIILQNIYYDFGKSAIRTGAARELDALATLMKKYPSMEIELISHTDSRGSDEFNQKLSLARAESAKRYLGLKGIDGAKIKAFGYGESQLRNDCRDGVECPEEEHEFNRRTEVKITKIDRPVKVEYRVKKP